ncbi:977c37c1-1276-4ba3-a131-d19713aef281 [Thermothielavioides terrestris]|uniref:977c37c1-1276-4ba3-a131-d19713aef281 n=1 Tax=Thermothielavioides terrestris TaxID=2587410 RepID=A0A446BY47_9PEZI|nr:977c37c1-1276-4ba3-a131-d19713aef281 [Thermothielavioides terrestris]
MALGYSSLVLAAIAAFMHGFTSLPRAILEHPNRNTFDIDFNIDIHTRGPRNAARVLHLPTDGYMVRHKRLRHTLRDQPLLHRRCHEAELTRHGICADYVVLPCGCSRAAVSPTTVTICPTRSPCYQCTTGWGIATITDSNCPPSATPTTAPTAAA